MIVLRKNASVNSLVIIYQTYVRYARFPFRQFFFSLNSRLENNSLVLRKLFVFSIIEKQA